MAAVLVRVTRTLVWGLCGGLIAWCPRASAQGSEPISDDEVQTYLLLLGENLSQCDLGWLEQQFLPSARIRFFLPGNRRETFTVRGYLEYMQTHCNPTQLQFEKRQLTSTQITDAFGGGKIVRWKFWWGRREGATTMGPATAEMTFENEALLVKQRARMRMTQATWRVKELVAGAAARHFGGAVKPLDALRGWLQRTGDALTAWSNRLRTNTFPKPVPTRVPDGW